MLVTPAHTFAAPLMMPGAAGAEETLTTNEDPADVPQEEVAVTEMVPPAAPGVVLMLAVVEEPDHPPGSVHVYDVAPLTGVML